MALIYASASQEVVKMRSQFQSRKESLERMQVTLLPKPKWSKVDNRYYANNAHYSYTYNKLINHPNLCSRHEKVFLLFAIRSTYNNFAMRYILREQLNQQYYVNHGKNIVVEHVFLFGKSNTFVTDQLIQEENRLNNDILQDDFQDSLVNEPLKEIMAWKWALEFCPNTEYMMIANDDIFVDANKIVPFLLQDLQLDQIDDHVALCYAVGLGENFHRKKKTYAGMPENKVYQGAFYPRHCHRFGYAVHINVANKLYKASMTNPPILPIRIWVAILVEKLRLKLLDTKSRYVIFNVQAVFANPEYPSKEVMIGHSEDAAYAGRQLQVINDIWSHMKRRMIKKLHTDKIVVQHSDDGVYRLVAQHAVLICVPSVIVIILFYRYLTRRKV